MSQAHVQSARGGQPEERAGLVILLVAATVAGLLVIAGLIYATGTGARDQASLLAAGCEPGLSSNAQPCITQPMLASEYKAILTPASRQMDIDEAAYTASEGRDLAAAEAALTAETATEQAFDTRLASIRFPPAVTPVVRALILANQARAKLTAEQARSGSLTQMRSFNPRIEAATTSVQTELNLILKAVDAPVRRPAGKAVDADSRQSR